MSRLPAFRRTWTLILAAAVAAACDRTDKGSQAVSCRVTVEVP